ncbi:TetR/AcrR family transcriptional regulator [Actinomycetospora termitidis]|uniref:Helix-turn-helix domain-containing protein n=1 Tax=Actinomycetospora termitidis TaxID=3053470 RepID=A0ABT7MDK3_9PSEU|nr:TetR/AcrR family transcriptional regulator [Actinomycetospora sp. Odt1-22]MDL5158745.1 helix-turn-helix domain-containing protein [Actinomycetospora sp. Odt1-22]
MPGGPRQRGRYHHGDLAPALLDAGLDQLAAVGPARFSVAEVARGVGVSTAAPYRHFADRDGFLAAVAARAAERLADAVRAAATDDDPRERLAAAGGAYAAAVAERRVGFDVIFSPALRAARDPGLAEAGRALMELFLEPAREIAGDRALELTEQVVALAHGYATLDADGFLTADRVTDEPTAVRARRAARALIDGAAPS